MAAGGGAAVSTALPTLRNRLSLLKILRETCYSRPIHGAINSFSVYHQSNKYPGNLWLYKVLVVLFVTSTAFVVRMEIVCLGRGWGVRGRPCSQGPGCGWGVRVSAVFFSGPTEPEQQ